MDTIALIAGIILVLILWGIVEHSAAEVGRSAEREPQRPRYKTRWQILAILLANGLSLGAYFYISPIAGAITVVALFLIYSVFRYLLLHSAAMQRRFLTTHLPPDVPTANNRNI